MKTLITANSVREAHAQNRRSIEIVLKDSIVTPEAYVVAEHLGVAINDTAAASAAPATGQDSPGERAGGDAGMDAAERQRIREHVLARLPEGERSESLVSQLVDKVARERAAPRRGPSAGGAAAAPAPSPFHSITGKGGIKVVDGASVAFERFEGAAPHPVGIADVVTAQDGSNMAAGFMQWDNAFFPWVLNYDEIDFVVDGELHVRHQGETLVARAGDVMFIPKGSAIEFGTPSHVRFLYVAWPADWQNC
ncbi:MAG: ethanolamine utilization acetate kinase EutQ [Telmatospirillum sp.]|nr:ethanolamine utilization acetate kinase EutQ [Telmatospirillum sp.]